MFLRRDALVHANEGIDNERIVHGAAALDENRDCVFVAQPWSIRSVRCESVEAVDDREDARSDGDVRPLDPVRIPPAVPVLMMVPDDRDDGVRKIDRREYVGTHARVELHLFELGGRQLSGLVEDVLRHGQLAHIV